MPILSPSIPTLLSGPSNAWGLVQFLQQRVPGYDPSEYLREINSAYIHVWEEITKLRNNWFTNVTTVTVAKSQFIYDFRYNADGGLSTAVSPRLYQILRIRVLPNSATGNLYQTSRAVTLQSPDFIAISSNPSATPTQTGPYYWVVQGKNSVQFGLPLSIGTVLEVTYSYWPLGLVYMNAGTVASSGTTVTGTNSFFTQLLPPDFQSLLPNATGTNQELAEAELICNTNQVYRVTGVASDFPGPSSASLLTCSATSGLPVSSSDPIQGGLYWVDYTDAQINGMGLGAWHAGVLKAMAHYGAYVNVTGSQNFTGAPIGTIEGNYAYGVAGVASSPANSLCSQTDWAVCTTGSPANAIMEGDIFNASIPLIVTTGSTSTDSSGRACGSGSGCDWTGHVHLLDQCVAKTMAGQPGGC